MVKNSPDSSENCGMPGTLQRGKACLRCRKRKMRCDGVKPACQQCIRAKKGDLCEYDNGRGKTRTQILHENISRLEQRIRELEDPEYTSPAVTLFDPHAHRRSESSSSSMDSPDSSSLSVSLSAFSPAHSPNMSAWNPMHFQSPSPIPFVDSFPFEESHLPLELSQMMLDIFAPHRHQCGLDIHIGRVKESLNLPLSEQRHPVLMNSIYLWSCYISRPGPLSQHESHYLALALEALGDGLRYTNKMIDVVQASCLLSMYFLCNGRVLEGSYHASAAASLAVQCGLHGGVSHLTNSWGFEPMGSFKVGPAKDAIEEGERISTFWQVYNLDRCWSVVLRKPTVIPDGRTAYTSINVPWPRRIEDYHSSRLDGSYNFQTIRAFFEGRSSDPVGGFSTPALRVKASAIFERADKLSSTWDDHLTASNTFQDEFEALEHTISHFITTLVPLHQLDGTIPDDRQALIVVHTLAHAATMHLLYRFGQDDPLSYNKCIAAARSCVSIIKHITDTDFEFLDPIIGPCWTFAAEVLIRELNGIETSWPLMNSTDVRSEIGTVLFAVSTLSAKFPLLGFSAAKIQKRLVGM